MSRLALPAGLVINAEQKGSWQRGVADAVFADVV
jgi:hypothetical protein